MVYRFRVDLEDKGPLHYMVLRTIPIADHTVAEIVECGPTAHFRGYPVFLRTVDVGERPMMYIQGFWRMIKARVTKITELERNRNNALFEPKREHQRASAVLVTGRDSVRGAVQRTGTPSPRKKRIREVDEALQRARRQRAK